MTEHSKHKRTEEEKAVAKRNIYVLYTLSVSQLLSAFILMQSTPRMVFQHYKGDVTKSIAVLNQMTSFAAALEFALNPLFGNIADAFGRKPVLFLAPLATFLFRGVVATTSSLKSVIIGRLIVGALIPAFFTAMYAAARDILKDDRNGTVSFFGTMQLIMGLTMAIGNILSGKLTARNSRLPYIISSFIGLATAFLLQFGLTETLHPNERKPFAFKSMNPFSFITLFTNGSLLAKLNSIIALQTFPRFTGDLLTVFAKEKRGWEAEDVGKFASLLGVMVMISGKSVPIFHKRLGNRKFTTVTNFAAIIAYIGWANAVNWIQSLIGLIPLTVAAMRGHVISLRIAEVAKRQGIGMGELGAKRANLTAAVKATSPLLYSWLFQLGVKYKMVPLPYLFSAMLHVTTQFMITSI